MRYVKMFGGLLVMFSMIWINRTFADVLLNLPKGTILGMESETYSGKPYYSFQKIPYAAPPIGNLRFKPPIPPNCWEGVLFTTYLDVICYQITADLFEENEDCLYLNVFTPELPSDGKILSIPVFLYIYGGAFQEGHALQHKRGPEYLMEYDIIVVTLNYRLGPLGFLSTEDEVIPGNNGLKDQHLAIKWVYDNIHLFGGDPKKITISGESAGAASVSFHVLNKKSEGLLRGAIMESGTAINPWAIQRNSRELAFSFANVLNSTYRNINDSKLLLEYLQSVPAKKLDDASTQVSGWSPVIKVDNEEAIITEKMYGLLLSGNYVKVPVLMGINSEESLEDVKDIETLMENLENFDDHPEELVPVDMNILNLRNRNEFGRAIRQIYAGNGTFSENLAAGVRFNSDASLTRAIIRDAEVQSQLVDVFFYQFSYDGLLGDVNVTVEGAERVAHAEELRYLWRSTREGYDNSDLTKFPPKDVITQRRMLTLWTNFVKYLNPTPEPLEILQNVTWPTVSSGSANDFLYLDIDADLIVKNHPKEQTYKAWTELYDILGYQDFDTY